MTTRRWLRFAAAGTLVVLVVLAASPIIHGHPGNRTKSDDHCAVCHLRHVSALEAHSTPLQATAFVVERVLLPEVSIHERGAYLDLRPSRGPPA
ncbi:MAG TPA: hypothetical protein VIE88_07125 [Vicinamibacteria bacterium]|jgi:hypothetical protein